MLTILWLAIASLPLIVFYMKIPVLASRYMIDFAPAFVAALAGLWYWAIEEVRQRVRNPQQTAGLLLVAFVLWQGSEIALA